MALLQLVTERTTKYILKSSRTFTYIPMYLLIASLKCISTIKIPCIELARLILNSELLISKLFSDRNKSVKSASLWLFNIKPINPQSDKKYPHTVELYSCIL